MIGASAAAVDYLRGNGPCHSGTVASSPRPEEEPRPKEEWIRAMHTLKPAIGGLLREWRQRRRMTQLDFACEADISTRHLSFLETGRSQPSREMLLRLAEILEVPLRDQNVMLTAAGFAPIFRESTLADPEFGPAREAIDLVLKGHEPYPALAVDRHWNLVAANAGVTGFVVLANAELLKPPLNVMRLTLHPDGLASRILNLAEWRAHLLSRLKRQVELTGDKTLADLLVELSAYPYPKSKHEVDVHHGGGVLIPMQFSSPVGKLSLFTTITVFGTPIDVTLSELALECFYPADAQTAALLRAMPGEGAG